MARDDGNGDRRITWKVVAYAAAAIIMLLCSLLLNGFDKRLNTAEARIEQKMDRAEHDKDMATIKELFQIIRDDIQRHESAARRRGP